MAFRTTTAVFSNPHRGMDAVRDVEKVVKEYGMRGIATDPYLAHISPSEARFYPIYTKCCELNVPVFITMAPPPMVQGALIEYTDPRDVDKVARDFPELTIIMSHGGYPFVQEAIFVCQRNRNVYMDCSEYERAPMATHYIESLTTGVLADKIIFASAHPFIEQKDAIAVLTIDRERALNALNSEVLGELDAAIDAIDLDAVRCLIITGAGQKSFVAGADIGEMSTLSKAEGEAFGKKGNDVFRKIEKLPIPVIAAVNGFALGGGCELSMSCDIRLASENAVFGQPETGLGITPGFGGTQRLARIIPVGKAKEMLYAGTKVKADEALSLGLVNAVYPSEELLPAAEKLAAKIARNAPIAVRASKKAVDEGLQVSIDEAIVIEEKLFGSCFETEDQRNGMAAFLNKEKAPAFQNK